MTLKRLAYVGGSILLVLFAASVLFLGNQRLAFAEEINGEDINNEVFDGLCQSGMTQFCDDEPEDTGESDPCDLPGMAANPGCDDTDNNTPNPNPCDDIFPYIPGMDCDDDNGGGGGGGNPVDVCTNEETDPGVQESGPCNSDDVCPSDDGIQTTTPCPSENTNSGGGNSGGGSSGGNSGGGGGVVGGGSYPAGQVLGAAIGGGTNACEYITSFIKPGEANDTEQVYRLQAFLKVFEGATGVEMTGLYDEASIAAVHAFQTKYAAEILTPWGIDASTGNVYLTTRKKINEIYCDRGIEFPLTEEEQQEIAGTKVAPVAPTAPAAHEEEMEHGDVEPVEEETEEVAPVVDTPRQSVWGFFRGLFDWLR